MRVKIFCILFFSLFSLSLQGPTSWAQHGEKALAHIMEQLKRTQESIEDFTADIIQVKHSSLFKEPVISKGKMKYKHPNQIWVEMKPPYPNITVLKGGVLWIYFPEEKVAQRYQVAGNPFLTKWLLFVQNPIETVGKKISLQEEKKGEVVLSIDPTEDLAIFHEIKIWIDTSNWMIKRLELVEKNRDRTIIDYLHIKINSGIPDSSFELKLPPDVEIVEPMKR